MVVNLFDRGGLQQDTGLLRERWNQEGSEVKDGTVTGVSVGDGNVTIFTVTAGKTFYLKSFIVWVEAATVSVGTLKDNATTKISLKSAEANNQKIFTFDAPVKFETSVVDAASTTSWDFSVYGWEE